MNNNLSWNQLGICPECERKDKAESALILRNNIKDNSQFLACASWPACNFTISFWTQAQIDKQQVYKANNLITKND